MNDHIGLAEEAAEKLVCTPKRRAEVACPTTSKHQLRDHVGQALSPVSAFFRTL
jgi:hypothetical protein